MSERQSSDEMLCAQLGITKDTLKARMALNIGVSNYCAGSLDEAASDFLDAQKLAHGCTTTRNTAKLYRGTVMFTNHLPGFLRIPEEAEANDKLLVDAVRLYREVLADSPNEDQRVAAEEGLRSFGASR